MSIGFDEELRPFKEVAHDVIDASLLGNRKQLALPASPRCCLMCAFLCFCSFSFTLLVQFFCFKNKKNSLEAFGASK